jgi:hypothetical protein
VAGHDLSGGSLDAGFRCRGVPLSKEDLEIQRLHSMQHQHLHKSTALLHCCVHVQQPASTGEFSFQCNCKDIVGCRIPDKSAITSTMDPATRLAIVLIPIITASTLIVSTQNTAGSQGIDMGSVRYVCRRASSAC